MENSSSSHDYVCSTSQEILWFLENLKGDYQYKRFHRKIQTKHSLNIPTQLSVCFVGGYDVQKNPPITLIMNLTKTIQSSHPISFKHRLSQYTLLSPK